MMTKLTDTKPVWSDEDDAPELTADFFERAEIRKGDEVIRPGQGTLTKRGRPRVEKPKRQVTLRLDSDVIDRLRHSGPGWQTRVNDALANLIETGRL
jgi:uncharacterized protein (DUF4415 family)